MFASIFPGLWTNIDRNNIGLNSIVQLAVNLINIALYLAGILAVIFIIIGGIKYIVSAGSPEGTKSAKNTMTNAVIGLVVVIFAGTIVSFIVGRLNG
jgi:hypothetical protein